MGRLYYRFRIDWNELALKVLAEDRDYDFVIMTTDMAEATAIRDAMAYLPIPEEMIQTYWEECWPCVRQGATHEGDIWMLPLEIYARGLVYNEKNMEEIGLPVENIKTIKDLHEAAKLLYEYGKTGRYGLASLQDHLLQDYLWKARQENSFRFDTPEFREVMAFVRETYQDNEYSRSYINLNKGEWYEEDNLLSTVEREAVRRQRQAAKIYFEETGANTAWDLQKYVGLDGLRVCQVPGMTDQAENVQVSGTFLVLNPNSKNKEELLEFVSAMSELYLENPSNFLSSNTECYGEDTVSQDIVELYRNGEIVFSMPDNLFAAYNQYVMGADLNPEEVIQELNRVVNMYYGE